MKKFFKSVGWWLIPVLLFVAIFLVSRVVLINSYIPSASMETTIMTGDSVIGNRLAYKDDNPARGDVIIFYFPDDESQKYIKRVVGLPGEIVEIINGTTYVNGRALTEPYLKSTPEDEDFGPYVVPENSYFCLGDNRNNSHDARYWKNKYVTKEQIIAQALCIYWPLDDAKLIK